MDQLKNSPSKQFQSQGMSGQAIINMAVLNHRLKQPSIGQIGRQKLKSGSVFKTIFEKEGGKIVSDLKMMKIIQKEQMAQR
jgi:hypothetical protein